MLALHCHTLTEGQQDPHYLHQLYWLLQKTVMLWVMLGSNRLKYCLTKILWLITLLAQFILNTESRNCVRSRNPRDNKAAGCDFGDWLWSSNHGRKKSCLSWNSVAWKEKKEVWLTVVTVLTGMQEVAYSSCRRMAGFSGCQSSPTVQLTCHCCSASCGKIKACDFFGSMLLNTDKLSFIHHTRLQARDGVGVQVTRDSSFLPVPSRVFLQEQGYLLIYSERLHGLQAGLSSDSRSVWLECLMNREKAERCARKQRQ